MNDYGTGIPQQEMESLVRTLIPLIQAFYESEEGKREFEEWRKNQEKQGEAKSKTA